MVGPHRILNFFKPRKVAGLRPPGTISIFLSWPPSAIKSIAKIPDLKNLSTFIMTIFESYKKNLVWLQVDFLLLFVNNLCLINEITANAYFSLLTNTK